MRKSIHSKTIRLIKEKTADLHQRSDAEIMFRAEAVRKKALQGEPQEHFLVDLFALVQEVSRRKVGLKHFDVQLEAGLTLNEGRIVEMKTGEGKTLVSTLPASLNALNRKGVHIVTVNNYLANRDWKWMGNIYETLGLTSGLVSVTNPSAKKKSYDADITYSTGSELVFDFLRDGSACYKSEVTQRPFHFCLIDEIDSILIDESRTPLIISQAQENKNLNELFLVKRVSELLEKESDYQLDKKRREINLTENGYQKAKTLLGKSSLFEKKLPFVSSLLNALKAKHFFKRDKDYIVLKNKILIVDELTGRVMPDRRWSMGLHEAIEAKERCELGGGTKTKSSITYQNFFTLYPKLSGMTGTAKTAEQEFQEIYGLKVIVLPTAKRMIRRDLPDSVYKSEVAKWNQVLLQSKACFEKGQPVLIGTASIEKSDFLSDLFKLSKIPHKVLNAKPENVSLESEIIAQAGQRSAVTIATNMAGRGTDIILGGNPLFATKKMLWKLLILEKADVGCSEFLDAAKRIKKDHALKHGLARLQKIVRNVPYSLTFMDKDLAVFYSKLYAKLRKKWERENEAVKSLGGLLVLGTEHNEARRIDNQLRGRAGRQGDPGIARFFVSLEDELFQIFGGKKFQPLVDFLGSESEAIESKMLTKSIEKAQNRVELYHYEIRKSIFDYDEILNQQRKQFFEARSHMIADAHYHNLFLRLIEYSFDKKGCPISLMGDQNVAKRSSTFAALCENPNLKRNEDLYSTFWVENDLGRAKLDLYQKNFLKSSRAALLLSMLDSRWSEHAQKVTYIKETTHLRAYSQQSPLTSYVCSSVLSFVGSLSEMRLDIIDFFKRTL